MGWWFDAALLCLHKKVETAFPVFLVPEEDRKYGERRKSKTINTTKTTQKGIFRGDEMIGKKGVFSVLIALALLSVLLSACMLIKKSDSLPTDSQNPPDTSENVDDAAILPTTAAKRSCDDSQDDGNDQYTRGITKVTYNQKITSLTDVCTNAQYLTEYYCDGTEYKSYNKLCVYGCQDGVCQQQEQGPVEESPQVLEPEPLVPERPTSDAIPECLDGFRDMEETDTDCGGPNCKSCGFGKHCRIRADCVAPLTCNQRNFLCLEKSH